MRTKLATTIEYEEGRSSKPYKDSLGFWTIGVGHLIGKNLTDLKLSDNIINAILKEDLKNARKVRAVIFPQYKSWSHPRIIAVTQMIFQMGETRFKKFFETIKYINAGEWEKAANNALKSLWAKQTPKRAVRICYMLKTGFYHPEYKL